jgi:hypothetical protein
MLWGALAAAAVLLLISSLFVSDFSKLFLNSLFGETQLNLI